MARKEITLPDGRVVSKQRFHVINNDKAKELQKLAKKKYLSTEKGRLSQKNGYTRFQERFLKEHGVSYSSYRYRKAHESDKEE